MPPEVKVTNGKEHAFAGSGIAASCIFVALDLWAAKLRQPGLGQRYVQTVKL